MDGLIRTWSHDRASLIILILLHVMAAQSGKVSSSKKLGVRQVNIKSYCISEWFLCGGGSSKHHTFPNQSFLVLMPFAHTERLLEVVELYSSSACSSSIYNSDSRPRPGFNISIPFKWAHLGEALSASGGVGAASPAAEWCHVWVCLRPASVCCEKLERWLEKRLNGWTVSRLKFLTWICLMYPLLTHVFSRGP